MKNDPLKKRGKVQLVKWIIAHSKRSCACLIDACVLSNDLEYTDHELQTQTHTHKRARSIFHSAPRDVYNSKMKRKTEFDFVCVHSHAVAL